MLPQTASSAAAGCVVVVEGDPPPASPLGRISFKGFNPATDKLRVSQLARSTTVYTI